MSHDDHQNSPQLNQSQWLTGTAITPIAIDMIQNAEREVVILVSNFVQGQFEDPQLSTALSVFVRASRYAQLCVLVSSTQRIIAAVKAGKLDENVLNERVDNVVNLILKAKKTLDEGKKTYDVDAHHDLACRVAEGSIQSTLTDSLCYEYSYTLRLILLDFATPVSYQHLTLPTIFTLCSAMGV